MDQISIHSDKGEIKLRKSKALVGLKMAQTRGLDAPDYINKEVLQSLGGFKIVELSLDDSDINAKLDEIRKNVSAVSLLKVGDEEEVGLNSFCANVCGF